jgi:hypothetical protein
MENKMNTVAVGEPAEVAGRFQPVADTYARWTLDCVIELVTSIAEDYVKRYRQYRDVPEHISKLLTEFRLRTGSDPEWPNTIQRTAMFTPLVGASDRKPGSDRAAPFHEVSGTLRSAAVAYSERVYDTGEPMLKQAFVDAARHFRAYLVTLSGSVVDSSRAHTEPMFRRATEVLTTTQVAQAFGGLPPAPTKSWPLPLGRGGGPEYLDGNAGYLIEEVSRTVGAGGGAIKQQQFLMLQRAAAAGARTIDDTLDGNHEKDDVAIRQLIGNAYMWFTALRDLAGGKA